MVFAAVKMSPRRAVPMAAASSAIRTNPSRRDSTVPAAITAAERRVRSAILRPDSFFHARLDGLRLPRYCVRRPAPSSSAWVFSRTPFARSVVIRRGFTGSSGFGSSVVVSHLGDRRRRTQVARVQRRRVQRIGPGLRGRRVAPLRADPPVDADDRRTEQQGDGGTDQDPADAAVLGGLDHQFLRAADRQLLRGDHLRLGLDQTVLLGARVDLEGAPSAPRRAPWSRSGSIRRSDRFAEVTTMPTRTDDVQLVRDGEREGALAAGQVHLDLAAGRSPALVTRCTLPSWPFTAVSSIGGEPLRLVGVAPPGLSSRPGAARGGGSRRRRRGWSSSETKVVVALLRLLDLLELRPGQGTGSTVAPPAP